MKNQITRIIYSWAILLLFPFLVSCSTLTGGSKFSNDPEIESQQRKVEDLEREYKEAKRYAEEADQRQKAAKNTLKAAEHELKALEEQAKRRSGN